MYRMGIGEKQRLGYGYMHKSIMKQFLSFRQNYHCKRKLITICLIYPLNS